MIVHVTDVVKQQQPGEVIYGLKDLSTEAESTAIQYNEQHFQVSYSQAEQRFYYIT